ncbi:MAG TPA: hypothetical protein PK899_03435 [Spirochaetota bacterium]|nr:hypothetical protein [Spirochaetota bacterium]
MKNFYKLAVFYSTDELDLKDIESEIFTENREKVNFFFFHNRDMQFNKAEILKKSLLNELDTIQPEFNFKRNSLIMTKVIKKFDFEAFDKKVDAEYNDYLNKINYRIDCIFQTFDLFYRLYSDRNIIFTFPSQIKSNFNDILNKNEIKCEELTKINNIVRDLEVLHWINYYSKKNINQKDEGIVSYRNITNIYKLA